MLSFQRSGITKEKPAAFGLFLDMLLEFRRFRKLYIEAAITFFRRWLVLRISR